MGMAYPDGEDKFSVAMKRGNTSKNKTKRTIVRYTKTWEVDVFQVVESLFNCDVESVSELDECEDCDDRVFLVQTDYGCLTVRESVLINIVKECPEDYDMDG